MSASRSLSFVHRFEPPDQPGRRPILLLHGTGGNEHDLIGLGRAIAPGSALLSPRGQVLERGMPRFFSRLAEGVFDEDEIRSRVDELADFVEAARKAYDLEAPIAVGFSNGANVAAAMLLLRPAVLAGAALLRAMTTLADPPRSDLTGKPVLLVSGAADPIVPVESANRLAAALTERGATVDHKMTPSGHALVQADLAFVQQWLAELSRP